jgi:omega-amidase
MSQHQNILRVLMIQPILCWQDPAENRQQLEARIDEGLAGQNDPVDLILLPETFTTGFMGDRNRIAESMDGATVAWMKDQTASRGAAIAGSAAIDEGGQRFNRFLFVTPEGEVQHYDKRHLFAYHREHERYAAGNRRVVLSYRGWRICPQICYDLRFPVWCKNRQDYDLLVFVANWPTKRVNAWRSLLRARAIENQAYVIGINRVGQDGTGLEFPGQSTAYDGLGEELASLGDQVASEIVELDLDALNRLRTELPFLADADIFHIEV